MKLATERTILSILELDQSISKDRIREAICMLNGEEFDPLDGLPQVLRLQDVSRLLKISLIASRRFLKKGFFEKVYGGGKFILGITLSSYLTFIEQRTVRPPAIPAPDIFTSKKLQNRKAYEHHLNKIRWRLHLNKDATRHERLRAIDALLASDTKLSKLSVCIAAQVPLSSYIAYRQKVLRGPTIYQKRQHLLMQLIEKLHPNKAEQLRLKTLLKELRRYRIRTSIRLLKKLTLDMNYNDVILI